jgi:uncharacterized protein (TIGR00730 family)
MSSTAPHLAYKNEAFLDSSEARPIRILGEYLEPLDHFRREHVHDTVVFFGSARITEQGPLGRYYADAVALASRLTQWSRELGADRERFVVCSGGGPGIMEAANRGAAEAGGKTIGLNIGLPHEQRPNPYITPELNFEFRYFFMRKLWFAYLARALVVFPGGFGTLDELTEILTLSQTGKLSRPVPILLYGKSFWNQILNFDALVRHGLISEEDLRLFQVTDSVDEALAHLQRVLTPAFAEGERIPESPAIACSCDPHTHRALGAGRQMPCCAGEAHMNAMKSAESTRTAEKSQ